VSQVSLLSGVLASKAPEFAVSYPRNLEPVIVNSGISKGQLRSAAGAVQISTGPGIDRGGINWNDICYRVMGSKLVSVSFRGAVTILGDVGDGGPVSLDYSFDRLIIRSEDRLYYWTGAAFSQVTSINLGKVLDTMWIGGYTMTTDGTYIVVTELSDPTVVKPLKYGSAESDPDPITGLIRINNEAAVLNRYTIQFLDNQGGTGFPFVNVGGALINTGCVSATAKCLFGNTFAFVGSSRGDALGVYVAGSGSANKISTRVIDDALSAEDDPKAIVLERRVSRDELRLLMHLANETWCFMAKATEAAGEPVWYRLGSAQDHPYRVRNAVNVYGQTMVADAQSGAIGVLSSDVSSHFGEPAEWQFDAGLIYNGGKGAILDSVELICLPGRGDPGVAFMSMTQDGVTFGQEQARTTGTIGARQRRLAWRPHARIYNYGGIRFRGYDTAVQGFAACEITARGLN
jgi:hypothetical protein